MVDAGGTRTCVHLHVSRPLSLVDIGAKGTYQLTYNYCQCHYCYYYCRRHGHHHYHLPALLHLEQ